jgi:hypothetical protein
MFSGKTGSIVFLVLYPILLFIFYFQFNLGTLSSVVLFYIVPSVYLSIQIPKSIKKSLIFALVCLIPWVPIDYIAHLTGQWLVPSSVFPFKILGLVPIEDILWLFSLSYFTVIFYEYFLDKHNDKKIIRKKLKYLVALLFSIVIIFSFFYNFFHHLLYIPFFYFWCFLIIFFIPLIIDLFRKPYLISKFLPVGAYFFFLNLTYEVIALKLGWWSFPASDFIGYVDILGIVFPFEEFFFWIILTSFATLCYYEFFDDDEK